MITTIIPTYNHGKYLLQAVGSVLDQSFPPTELILIDGASTDGTRDLVLPSNFRTRITRFEHPRRMGYVTAFNEGVCLALTPWVHFMGADDVLLDREFYEKGLSRMARGIGIIAGNGVWMTDEGVTEEWIGAPPELVGTRYPVEMLQAIRELGNFVNGGACLVRREALLSVPPFDASRPMIADALMWVRIFKRGWKASLMGDRVYGYRRHEGQMTAQKVASAQDRAFLVSETL